MSQDLARTLLAGGLPDFEIGEVIGRGGMATVYSAYDKHGDIPVAIKVIDPEQIAASMPRKAAPNCKAVTNILARALKEARILFRSPHPNIVRVYRTGRIRLSSDEDVPEAVYVVMELMFETITNQITGCANGSRIPWSHAETVRKLRTLLSALTCVHEKEVIHRDIKPDNVMIGKDGELRLVDFGIAHSPGTNTDLRTRVGQVVGTMNLMAPEQYGDAANVTPAADIYGIGQLLHMALTNKASQLAFWIQVQDHDKWAEATDEDKRQRYAGHQFLWECVPGALVKIIRKATCRHPQDRYQSAREMDAALAQVHKSLSAFTIANPTLVADPEDYGLSLEYDEGSGDRPALPTTPVDEARVPGGTVLPWSSNQDDEERPARRRFSPVMGLGAAALIVLLGGGWWWSSSGDAAPIQKPQPVVASAPSAFAPEMVADVEVPGPVMAQVEEPEVPVAEPVAQEHQATEPDSPSEQPVMVASTVVKEPDLEPDPPRVDTPDPEPEKPVGSLISVSGVSQASLKQGSVTFTVPGMVPDGSYSLLVQFPGEDKPRNPFKGNVTVSGPAALKCNTGLGMCQWTE
ncbi:protein kinase [Candidatus Uhrbacteria bacterium]|nr:protein kinase [Candidatus Uhrbacteria bacterium]